MEGNMTVRSWIMIIIATIGFALWGCSDDETPVEVDTTPPTVVTTYPVDGDTNVPIDINILIGFSEDMTVSSLNKSTIQIQGIPTDTVLANRRTAALIPLHDLFYDSTYTAVVTTGVRDAAGNNMQANYIWTFTVEPDTSTPPGR
jgi:hypothetical protein